MQIVNKKHPMQQLQARIVAICGLAIVLTLQGQLSAQGLLALRGARIETVGKDGVIEDGIMLVRNGKIEDIGKDVDIPVSAQVIELSGMTIMPGIVDPYYVVPIGRNVQASEPRTIVFGGRTFVIGGGAPAIATTFARIADSIHVPSINWNSARRSGLTTLHVVTGGYAQSLFAQTATADVTITQPNGKLLTTVTNESKSLDVLRNGLKEPRTSAPTSGSGGSSTALSSARGETASSAASSSSPAASASDSSPTQLWKDVREGKSHVFVNVNNPAAILHTLSAVSEAKQVKVAFIASGAYVFQALDSLDARTQTIILAPTLDTIPNSRNRVNVPSLLAKKKIAFAFSPSLGQSDFRAQQDTPLFGVGMLVRSGLDRKLALEACTLTPAKLLGLDAEIGTLEIGKRANFIVLDGDPFGTTTGVQHIFIDGKPIYEN
jgi:hypothetical protein